MFHLGKVLRVIGVNSKDVIAQDTSFQAYLEMWDKNQVIVLIHSSLCGHIKSGDFVLVKYTQPEPTVWKILKPKAGKELWDSLEDFLNKKNQQQSPPLNLMRPDSGFGKMIG